METGRPFLTKELVEQRARQRRTLREIPDSVIQRVRTASIAGPVGHTHDPLIETKLRELADKDIRTLRVGSMAIDRRWFSTSSGVGRSATGGA
jgi:hypothetical protein